MILYGYILASVLNYCLHFWSERRAYYSASLFVGFGQIITLFGLSLMLQQMAGVDWLSWLFKTYPYLLIFIIIGWLVALSYYYTLDRVETLQKKLAEKTEAQRIMWGIIAILSYIAPGALLYFFSRAK